MARTAGLNRHRRLILRNPRLLTITDLLTVYNPGQTVCFLYNSRYHNARAHPRLHGKIGRIVSAVSSDVYAVSLLKKCYNIHVAHLRRA